MRKICPWTAAFFALYALLFSSFHSINAFALSYQSNTLTTISAGKLRVDPRLPSQTISADLNFNNFNGKFGSRFDFVIAPWRQSEMSTVFKNASSNSFGTYFQHDQGGEVSNGQCTSPGYGTPTIRSSCYTPPYFPSGTPMPVEENDNTILLTAYYVKLTHDTSLATQHIQVIDAAMQHNQRVADPNTGLAYNFQDTSTTYDDQPDCLHNNGLNAGNLYYQGLKEATGYHAAAYLDSFVSGDKQGTTWKNNASKIENAMIQKYNSNGFIPLAENNNAFNNCNARSLALGEGLFYLQMMGLIGTVNSILVWDLAKQYPADLSASRLTSPSMVVIESTPATGWQCPGGTCKRYEWFSKIILSSIIADLVYAKHGCTTCHRLNIVQPAYNYNIAFQQNFADGFHDYGSDWPGHFYPRSIISWAFLNAAY